MRKRILALSLALVLVLSMLPAGVAAEAAPTGAAHAHVCEHCRNTGVTWTQWDGTTAMADGGHYYLKSDVTLAAAVTLTEGSYTLCLNGKTLTATGGRHFYLSGTAQLTITDCTASGTGESYIAGTVKGATSSAFMFKNEENTASLTIYDGIFTGNKSGGGGVVCLQAGATMNIHGGLFKDNTATANGGALFVSKSTLHITGGQFVHNTAVNGGAVYTTVATVQIAGTSAQEQVVFDNNIASTSGGGMYLNSTAGVTMQNVTLTENRCKTGGSAVHMANSKLRMESCTVEKNNNVASTAWTGPVYALGASALTVGSSVTFEGNTLADAATEKDITLQDATTPAVVFDGIQKDELFTIHTIKDTKTDANALAVAGPNMGYWNFKNVVYGNTGDYITFNPSAGKFQFVKKADVEAGTVHAHCAYGCAESCDHAVIVFKKYTDAATLPGSGAWYLDTGTQDKTVTLSSQISVTGLDICLHGHTVKAAGAAARVFSVASGGKLSISDCTGGGKLTGATKGAILTNYNGKDMQVNLYGGTIAGNHSADHGGAVVLQGGVVMHMYGGEISGNSVADGKYGGGIFMLNGATFQLHGGTICDNKAKNGGGIYANKGGVLELLGGAVRDNIATADGGGVYLNSSAATVSGSTVEKNQATAEKGNGAGFYVYNNSQLTVSSGAICGNVAGEKGLGGGVFVSGEGSGVTVAGGTIEGNKAQHGAGMISQTKSVITVTGGTVSGNAATADGGGVYVSTGTTLNLEGGTIEKNTAGSEGGGVYLLKSTLNMCGGKVADNSAKLGGGIFANADSTVKLSGAPQITGNTATGKASNLYLQGNTLQMYVDAMTEGAKVAVSAVPNRAISTPVAADYSGVFISDQSLYKVKYLNGALYLDVSQAHDHCGCGGTQAAGCDHGQIKFLPLDSGDALPTSGNYYLTGDMVVSAQTRIENGTLNLCLNGHTIKVAKPATRVFYVSGNGKLRITDCTGGGKLTGATAGAILTDAKGKDMQIELFGGAITGNHSTDSGGAVVLQGDAVMHMYGGEISKNSAADSKYGGGIFLLNGATFQLHGGTVCDNRAKNGGGIYANKGGVLELLGGTVRGNTAAKDGGGVYLNSSAATVSGSTVEKNQATAEKGNGAGFYVYNNSQLTVSGGRISDNQAGKAGVGGGIFVSGEGSQLVMTGGTVSGNTAKFGAGVISQTKSTITMKGGSVTQNKASTNGGGVYVSTGTTLNMTDGLISKNSSQAGGGVYLLKSTLNMRGGKISNNTAKNDGGGMYMYLSQSTFTGGSITGNSAKNAGGIRITGGKHRISGLSVSYNMAQGDGGGIQVGRQVVKENGIKVDKMPDFVINSINLIGNKSKNGGGILMLSKGAKYTIHNAYIANNEGSNGGGGIYVSTGATLYMYGGTVTENYGKTGGGIVHLQSNGNYENVTISKNTGNNGVGMMVNKSTGDNSVHLKNVKILDNVGQASGALVVQGENAALYMDGCQVSGNATPKTGGALFATVKAKAYVKNTTFDGNSAGVDAGAVMLGLNSVMELENCTITGNKAEGNGGGVYNRGLMYIRNSKVLNNTSGNNGGGIGSGKTGAAHTGDQCGLFMENVISSGNQAGNNGGGLFGSLGCHVVATDLTLTDNTAQGNGGGAWAQEDFMVENLVATGNRAALGAVYLAASHYDGQSYFAGAMKFSGKVVIRDNQGGGVYISDQTTLTLAGDTLAEGSYMNVELKDGVLTQKVFGVYDYEGGDLHYVITPGNRSITEPELLVQPAAEPEQNELGLYLGIAGVAVLVMAAVVILMVLQKKKSGSAAQVKE